MAAEARAPKPLLVFEQNPSASEHELARLPPQALVVMRLCDGMRTLPAICAASALTHEQTLKVIDRLLALKLVAARRASTPSARATSPDVNAVNISADAGKSAAAVVNAEAIAAAIAIANTAHVNAVHVTAKTENGANGSAAAKPNGNGANGAAAKAAKPRPAAASPAAAQSAAFSADEELFFASSIDHLVGDEFYK